ncbi:MAG: LacI family transcriptional regulator [Limnochordia bacterium]|nr:LacI family transcriptional regulator [Limnochordia bacterium]
MAATIKEVAKLAGVSMSTVSHVMNGTRYVSPALRQRIERAAKELNYKGNDLARSLARGFMDIIALVVRDISNPFFSEIAAAVQCEAEEHGYDIFLYNTADPSGTKKSREEHFVSAITRWPITGLIICQDLTLRSDTLQELRAKKIPVVMISPVLHEEIDAVYIDDEQAAYDATQYLIAVGHKRIAHISGSLCMATGQARLRGYVEAMKSAGLPVEEELVKCGHFTMAQGAEAMQEFIVQSEPPTAVFAANDVMAFGALKVALEAGQSVPSDVAVMGFDDVLPYTIPALSSVYHAQKEMGQIAVQLVIRRVKATKPLPRQEIVVPHKLMIRDTT